MSNDMSLYTIFYERVRSRPEKVCLYRSDLSEISFEEVLKKSLQTATLLKRSGIEKGSRVAVMVENSPHFIYIMLALSRLEAVMVPINTHYKSLALRHVLSDSMAEAVIYDNGYSDQMENALEVLEHCSIRLVTGDEDGGDLLIDPELPLFGGPFSPRESDGCVVYYSAGTLGPPKGAVYSNGSILNNMRSVFDLLHPGSEGSILLSYPFYHYFAQICGIGSMLLGGIAIVVAANSGPGPVLKDGIPETCRIIIDIPDRFSEMVNNQEMRFPDGLEFCLSGGQAMERTLPREFRSRFNLPLYQGYGMVEAGPVLTMNMNAQKEDSIGIAVHDTTVMVMDGERVIRQGEYGSLVLAANQLVSEFCGRYRPEDIGMRNGWFYSPDMAYQDIDGYLYFLDRRANRIQINGFDVFPEVIENKLQSHEDIAEAAAIGTGSAGRGEYIQAYLVLRRGRHLSEGDIIDWLENKLPKYQIPKEIIFVDHLPKNIAGKVSRQTLRKNAVSRAAAKLEE